MNSLWHLYISIVKSLIRIAGCAAAIYTKDVVYLAIFFGAAEILGIVEEVGDKR